MVLCGTNTPGSSESSVWESDWESEDDPEARDEMQIRQRKLQRRRVAARGAVDFGNNCHSCRGKSSRGLLFVKCAICPLWFCARCLLRKHGEDAAEESENGVRWTCPLCRGGCGPGCYMNCCVCGPCRRNRELEPAGRILEPAIKAGFNNTHDYLVHFETGETADAIARRKNGRGWTKSTSAVATAAHSIPKWAMKKIRNPRKHTEENGPSSSKRAKRCLTQSPLGNGEEKPTRKPMEKGPSSSETATRGVSQSALENGDAQGGGAIPDDADVLKRKRRPTSKNVAVLRAENNFERG